MRDRDRYETIVSDPTKSENERNAAQKRLREYQHGAISRGRGSARDQESSEWKELGLF
jgi:hypothetical protein